MQEEFGPGTELAPGESAVQSGMARRPLVKRKLVTPLIASLMTLAAGAPARAADEFPFQPQAIQFRLNQGFFKTGGDMLEDILKSSGLIDAKNRITIADVKNKVTHYIQYRSLKTTVRLYEGQMVANFSLDIADSNFVVTQVSNKCRAKMTGRLSFDVALLLNSRGAMEVAVPSQRFDDSRTQLGLTDCGLMGVLVRGRFASSLQTSIQEAMSNVVNDQELRYVTTANVDKALREANVFINVPSKGPLTIKNRSQFDIDMGVMGYLSNARSSDERIVIGNPKKAYMNQVGMQWALDAGLQAKSKNIYNPGFRAAVPTSKADLPEWGLAPYQKTGKPVDFDAGLMIRTGFLKNLFETLYQAGFFNLQVQDSLLDKKTVSIDPTGWGESFRIVMPDGQRLTKANYKDSRLELKLAAPPVLNVRNEREFQLIVPDFQLAFFAVSKAGGKEFEVVRFRAKFNLNTQIGMSENGRLSFVFNENPLEDFEILSRSGVAGDVPDMTLEKEMNKAVVSLMNQANVDIPFMKDRKIEIKSLGIDASKNSDKALAIYLKIK